MNKTQKIRLDVNNPNDTNNIKFRLEQNVETLELLTLKLETKDFYRYFNADYGVLVGRVIANDGIGIPNAKISIFIPLSETDELDEDIVSLYPYKKPTDKNLDGKRYNLLPRVGEKDPETNIYKPKQPFGSFPTKPEIVTNKNFLDVYKKYYKFTTITNSFGDYMIFGAPVGLYTVHLSVDLTDIGKYSMTPMTMVTELGYSPNLFTNNNTRIKPNNDLDDLPHIETQEISVDIVPFWGDTENFQIGLTRQDFRIRAQLVNTFVVFGTSFTDGPESAWGTGNTYDIRNLYRIHPLFGDSLALFNLGIESKRTAVIKETIIYYPNTITDDDIVDDSVNSSGLDMLVLDKSMYSSNKRNGDYVFEVSCNRRKVITNDIGDEIEVSNDYPGGIFTEFRGFFIFEYDDNLPINLNITFGNKVKLYQKRARLKIPQKAEPGDGIGLEKTEYDFNYTPNVRQKNDNWIKEHKIFKGGNFYTVSQFFGTVANASNPNRIEDRKVWIRDRFQNNQNSYYIRYFSSDELNNLQHKYEHNNIKSSPYWNVGVILTNSNNYTDNPNDNDVDDMSGINESQQFPTNGTVVKRGHYLFKLFGANWLNMCIYLPQISHLSSTSAKRGGIKCTTYFTTEFINFIHRHTDLFGAPYVGNNNWFSKNNELIGANVTDISRFLRNDLHWTDFVNVDVGDLTQLLKYKQSKGLILYETGDKILDYNGINITNPPNTKFKLKNTNFRNGLTECPFNGGKKNGKPNNPIDPHTYIYKGHGDADCLQYLNELGYI
jgi:hypothetical protein